MRPIILKVNKDNNIVLSAEEIESLINNAYEQGYEDGKKYSWENGTISVTTQCRNPYDVA